MTAARKQSETAAILRAGRAKTAASNATAKRTHAAAEPLLTRNGKPKQKHSGLRERLMINCPVEDVPDIKAAAAALGVSMSTFFVMGAREKMRHDQEKLDGIR
jgi:hypothetical protein